MYNQNLPLPLNEEEINELLILIRKDDIKARNTLIEHSLRLVVYIAQRYKNTVYQIEDLISIGAIGLIKAVNSYTMEEELKFNSYVTQCIDDEIKLFLKSQLEFQKTKIIF
jgi:RNA polymerase sporulation-specific sigma factor